MPRTRIPLQYVPLLATVAACILLYTACCLLYPGFFSLRVFVNLISDNAFLGIIAVGMTFVILSGGIDLSVGSVAALCGTAMAVMIQRGGLHPCVAIPVGLLIGGALGFGMGCLIHYFDRPPFIVTLGGMFLARGLAYVISLQSITIEHGSYDVLSQMGVPVGGGLRLPLIAIVYLVVVLAGIYVTASTPFGRYVYAVGGNEEGALLMGLPVGRTKIAVYTVSGFCAALGAVVFTVYLSSGNPASGVGWELDAIASVVIGGTLLSGGVGGIAGTFVGVLIFGIIQAGITFQGTLSSWWTRVFIGALLLVFILLQKAITTAAARARGSAATA